MVLADLEKEKKDLLASAVEKEKLLRVRWQPMDKPCRPIADTALGQGQDHWKPRPRVCACFRQRGQQEPLQHMERPYPLTYNRTTTWWSGLGPLKASPLRSATSCLVGYTLQRLDQCSSNDQTHQITMYCPSWTDMTPSVVSRLSATADTS